MVKRADQDPRCNLFTKNKFYVEVDMYCMGHWNWMEKDLECVILLGQWRRFHDGWGPGLVQVVQPLVTWCTQFAPGFQYPYWYMLDIIRADHLCCICCDGFWISLLNYLNVIALLVFLRKRVEVFGLHWYRRRREWMGLEGIDQFIFLVVWTELGCWIKVHRDSMIVKVFKTWQMLSNIMTEKLMQLTQK